MEQYQVTKSFDQGCEIGIAVMTGNNEVVMRFRYSDTQFGVAGNSMRDIHLPFIAQQLCDRLNLEHKSQTKGD